MGRAKERGRVPAPPDRRPHAAFVVVVLFVSFAYFHGGGGWNQNSRFDLTRAIVEQHSVRIDAYHENTGDKSRHDGHIYSDKAPGASLVAVPAYALVYGMGRAMGAEPQAPAFVGWLAYVTTIVASALPAAWLGCAVFLLARRVGARDGDAVATALIGGLCTPLWAYATLFWGHMLAASGLVTATLLIDRLSQSTPNAARDRRLGTSIGLAAGWAVVTEFPAAIPAGILAATALMVARSGGAARLAPVAVGIACGAGACAVVLGVYQWAAFDSPFHVGYASLEDPTLLSTGFFGITLPSMGVLRELLLGSFRGLLPLAPVLWAAPFGIWMLWRRTDTRPLAVVIAASTIYYLLLNAAYRHWEGGWSYGPRHLAPAVALATIGLAPLLQRASRFVRFCIFGAAAWGAAHSLVAVATTPQPPSQHYTAPMSQLLWPAFSAGELSLNTQSFLDALPPRSPAPTAAFNLGEKLGLRGRASLLPLAIFYLVAWRIWSRRRR